FDGTSWKPGVITAVEHPENLGRYGIVAAGRVRGDNNVGPIDYGGLRVEVVSDGTIRVSFAEYKNPDTTPPRVVLFPKVLLGRLPGQDGIGAFVTFQKYDDKGILLFISGPNGAIVKAPSLKEGEYFVEISKFPFS